MSSIKISIDSEVDHFCTVLTSENPFFLNAKSGKLTSENILKYVQNIHFLFQWTNINLKNAITTSKQMKKSDLVEFYEKKYKEECDHYKWAEDDIRAIKKDLITPPQDGGISKHLVDLMEYTKNYISKDPVLYLSYMYLAESTTARVGGDLLNAIETCCGVNKKYISSIDKHVVLDGYHAEEVDKEMEMIPDTEEYKNKAIGVIRASSKYLYRFFSEIGAVSNH